MNFTLNVTNLLLQMLEIYDSANACLLIVYRLSIDVLLMFSCVFR